MTAFLERNFLLLVVLLLGAVAVSTIVFHALWLRQVGGRRREAGVVSSSLPPAVSGLLDDRRGAAHALLAAADGLLALCEELREEEGIPMIELREDWRIAESALRSAVERVRGRSLGDRLHTEN
jgi:hypothetical protein